MLPMVRTRLATPTLFESSLEPWSDLRREIDRLFDSVLGGALRTACMARNAGRHRWTWRIRTTWFA